MIWNMCNRDPYLTTRLQHRTRQHVYLFCLYSKGLSYGRNFRDENPTLYPYNFVTFSRYLYLIVGSIAINYIGLGVH